jgi:pyridoxal phosphate enzyme (YggS family)
MEGFRERLESVRERVAAAARRSGRSPDAVVLVAVTKTVDSGRIREAMGEGLTVFGENRVQEARLKAREVGPGAAWHLVGHLQSNKAREASRILGMIHSVDSAELLRDLDRHAAGREDPLPVLIQVNLAGEESKHGVRKSEIPSLLAAAGELKRVIVVGWMTLPPYDPEPEKSRRYFRELADLAGRIRREKPEYAVMRELSMGMSEDLEVAVEEGATLIRVGRALFGERPAKVGKESE